MSKNIRFQIRTSKSAKTAELLGDFTGWTDQPIKMKKLIPGVFEAVVNFQEYRLYEYKFRVDGQWKEEMSDVSPSDGTMPNPFGTKNYYIDIKKRGGGTDDVKDGSEYDSIAEKILGECIQINNFENWDAYKKGQKGRINLEGINLTNTNLKYVDLSFVNLCRSKLKNADLYVANLEGALLREAQLQESNLISANLEAVNLRDANMTKAKLNSASLMNAQANYSVIKGADFHNTYLQGANFSFSIVDGETLLKTRRIDESTNFTGVGLGSARLMPGLTEILTHNIRKYRWNEWYNKGNLLSRIYKKSFCKAFWLLSDYGASTTRLVMSFFLFAILFASIYFFSSVAEVELIKNLSSIGNDTLKTNQIMCRSFYFSIVTMTTLGFGDMFAHPISITGYILLTIQVILGYVILGALISRLSILFITGGPAILPSIIDRKNK